MPYRLKVVLLSIGMVLGVAGGIRHMAHEHHSRRASLEERVTQICTEVARQACTCQPGAPAERDGQQTEAQP